MAESGLCREAGPERALQAWFFHTDQSVPAPSLGRKEQEKEGGQNVTLIQGLSILALLTFRAGQSFVVGAVLCIVGCSAASLASTHEMPVAPPFPGCDNQKCIQTLPDVWGPGRDSKITPSWEPLL